MVFFPSLLNAINNSPIESLISTEQTSQEGLVRAQICRYQWTANKQTLERYFKENMNIPGHKTLKNISVTPIWRHIFLSTFMAHFVGPGARHDPICFNVLRSLEPKVELVDLFSIITKNIEEIIHCFLTKMLLTTRATSFSSTASPVTAKICQTLT